MSSQADLPGTWPVFAGYELHGLDGSPDRPYLYSPSFYALAWANVGALIALWGNWPGDTRARPIWPHLQVGYPGPTTVWYWDMILGDHLSMTTAQIDANFNVVILHNDTLHVFTPYA